MPHHECLLFLLECSATFLTQPESPHQRLGDVLLPFVNSQEKILLKALPIIDGEMITDAKVSYDQNSQPVVAFSLDSKGARIFGDFSGANIGKRMAIVLDGKVYSAPVIGWPFIVS